MGIMEEIAALMAAAPGHGIPNRAGGTMPRRKKDERLLASMSDDVPSGDAIDVMEGRFPPSTTQARMDPEGFRTMRASDPVGEMSQVLMRLQSGGGREMDVDPRSLALQSMIREGNGEAPYDPVKEFIEENGLYEGSRGGPSRRYINRIQPEPTAQAGTGFGPTGTTPVDWKPRAGRQSYPEDEARESESFYEKNGRPMTDESEMDSVYKGMGMDYDPENMWEGTDAPTKRDLRLLENSGDPEVMKWFKQRFGEDKLPDYMKDEEVNGR